MYKNLYTYEKLNGLELFVIVWPFIFMALVAAAFVLPSFEFTAICQNVPGGDVCTITWD